MLQQAVHKLTCVSFFIYLFIYFFWGGGVGIVLFSQLLVHTVYSASYNSTCNVQCMQWRRKRSGPIAALAAILLGRK